MNWLRILSVFTVMPVLASTPQASFTHGIAVSVGRSSQLLESAHADEAFPLMSVVKFPLAIMVLHEVGQGRLALDDSHHLTAEQMDSETWSPLAKAHPQGGNFTLRELLRACLADSDNNACAFLFGLVGGPAAVHDFFRSGMGADFPLTITCGEDAFRDEPHKMVENNATPRAMTALLRACFVERRLLSPEHTELLWGIMSGPTAGAPRLRAGIPQGAVLAHKTGSSGTRQGFTLARNDVGVLKLQDGQLACIVSFIRDSRASVPEMDAAHAALARRVAERMSAEQP